MVGGHDSVEHLSDVPATEEQRIRKLSSMLREFVVTEGSDESFKQRMLVFHGLVGELINAQGSVLFPVRESSKTFIKYANRVVEDRKVVRGGMFIRSELLQPGRATHSFALVALDDENTHFENDQDFLKESFKVCEEVHAFGKSQVVHSTIAGKRVMLLGTPVFRYTPGDLAIEFNGFGNKMVDDSSLVPEYRSLRNMARQHHRSDSSASSIEEEAKNAEEATEGGDIESMAASFGGTYAESRRSSMEPIADVGAVLVQCFFTDEEEGKPKISRRVMKEVYELVYEARGMMRQSIEMEARQDFLYQSQRAMAAAMDASHILSRTDTELRNTFVFFQNYLSSAMAAAECMLFIYSSANDQLINFSSSGELIRINVDHKSLPGRSVADQEVYSLYFCQEEEEGNDEDDGDHDHNEEKRREDQAESVYARVYMHGEGGVLEDEAFEYDQLDATVLTEMCGSRELSNMICVPVTAIDKMGVIVIINRQSTPFNVLENEASIGFALAPHNGKGRVVPPHGESQVPAAKGAPTRRRKSSISGRLAAKLAKMEEAKSRNCKSPFRLPAGGIDFYTDVDVSFIQAMADEVASSMEGRYVDLAYLISQMDKTRPDEDLVSLLSAYDPGKRTAKSEPGNGKSGPGGTSSTSYFIRAPLVGQNGRNLSSGDPEADALVTGLGRNTKSTGSDMYTDSMKAERKTASQRLPTGPLASLTPVQVSEMDIALKSWDFDVLAQDPDHLVNCAMRIFQNFELVAALQLDEKILFNFFKEVKSNYLPNPYHNWMHAFSVLHASSITVRNCATELLKFSEVFALFLAAVCHDIAHPGTNNDFQINSESNLALLYNDVSVLENFHAATTFKILQNAQCNVLRDTNPQKKRLIRESIIKAILSTDISVHFKMVADLKGKYHDAMQRSAAAAASMQHSLAGSNPRRSTEIRAGAGDADATTVHRKMKRRSYSSVGGLDSENALQAISTCDIFNREERSDRLMVIECIIHSADLANPVLNFDLYRQWTELVVQEFYDQAMREKDLGLPSQPHMQNPPSDVKALGNMQISFIDYVVAPLWSIMRDMFPPLASRYSQLENNRAEWKRILAEFEKEEQTCEQVQEETKEDQE